MTTPGAINPIIHAIICRIDILFFLLCLAILIHRPPLYFLNNSLISIVIASFEKPK